MKLKLIRFLLLSFVTMGCFINLAAQTRSVSGTVLEKGADQPVIGATVRVKGHETLGVITDFDGKFLIQNVPSTAKKIIVSYVGLKTMEVSIKPNMVIMMEGDSELLDEVVIEVAYGTAKKTSITGAISNISREDIAKRPVSNVTSALEGTTTGLQMSNTYGQPGSSPSVRIRGFNTVNGSNSPLYVIDGVPFSGNITDLNSADIESISVLKDAASAALYGNRAANGVILITTRKGKSGHMRVRLNTNQGVYVRGLKEYERLDAKDWMEAMWTGYRNSLMTDKGIDIAAASAKACAQLVPGVVIYNIFNKPSEGLFTPDGKIVEGAEILPGYRGDLDWFKAFERTGWRQEYGFSGEGSSDKANYYFSTSYLSEEGYTKDSDYDRITGRANINLTPTKWFKTGFRTSASYQVTNFSNGDDSSSYTNPFNFARKIAPIYPIHLHNPETGEFELDADGHKIYDGGGELNRPQYSGRHLIWENELNMRRTYRNTFSGQLYATIDFLEDFSLTLKGDMSLRNSEYRKYDNAIIGDGEGNNGRAKRQNYRYKNFTVQQQLSWKKIFGKHYVNVFAAHEAYFNRTNGLYGYKNNETFAGKVDLSNFTQITDLDDWENNYRTESYLGRVRYNYDEKYFAEASFRRDGSSRFDPDHRWGNFWSVGGSWVMKREAFLKDVNWLNMLKFRASYGEVGNDAGVGLYGYMGLYTMDQNAFKTALYKSQNAAPDIKWETTASYGFAFEGQAFDRLNFTVEYFDKQSKDLLFDVNLPLSAGATSSSSMQAVMTKNLGTVSNRGLELEFDADIIRKNDWTWNFGFNTTIMKNKIKTLPEQNREDGIISGTKRYMEGHSVYDYWMYQFAGVDQMTGNSLYEPDFEKYSIDGSGEKDAIPEDNLVKIGDEYYVTKTTYARKDWSGSAIPDFFGAFNTSVTWKDLTLSAIMTYSVGGKCIDWSYMSLMGMSGSPYALHKDLKKAWNGVPEGMTENSANRIDSDGIPVIDYARSSDNNSTSTRFLTSRTYFVLKNIALNYQLPKKFTSKLGINSLSVNASIENLFTSAKRRGMDPQQSFGGSSNNFMVTPRVYSLGLNLSF